MSNPRSFGIGGGIGAIGSGIASLFGGGNDPYKGANQYFNKVPGILHEGYDPWVQGGQNAFNQTNNQFGQLMNDPGGKMNQLGQGYQQSPGYQWALKQGEQGITNAAAAGGMGGSAEHQQNAGQLSSDMANQDYYNYLNHVMSLYGTGLSGGQGNAQMGLNAQNQLTQGLSNNMQNQGALKYGSDSASNQSRGQGWGDILGGIGSLAAFGGFL